MGSGGCNLEECAQEEGGGTESSQRSGVIPKADSGMQMWLSALKVRQVAQREQRAGRAGVGSK